MKEISSKVRYYMCPWFLQLTLLAIRIIGLYILAIHIIGSSLSLISFCIIFFQLQFCGSAAAHLQQSRIECAWQLWREEVCELALWKKGTNISHKWTLNISLQLVLKFKTSDVSYIWQHSNVFLEDIFRVDIQLHLATFKYFS